MDPLEVLAAACGEHREKINSETTYRAKLGLHSKTPRPREKKPAAKRVAATDPRRTDEESTSGDDYDDTSSEGRSIDECRAGIDPGDVERDIKKHQRMIRNRQSAALSRKRKSDKIDCMQQRVTELEEANRGLSVQLQESKDREAVANAKLSVHETAAAASVEISATVADEQRIQKGEGE
jgi:hypothetical protein